MQSYFIFSKTKCKIRFYSIRVNIFFDVIYLPKQIDPSTLRPSRNTLPWGILELLVQQRYNHATVPSATSALAGARLISTANYHFLLWSGNSRIRRAAASGFLQALGKTAIYKPAG